MTLYISRNVEDEEFIEFLSSKNIKLLDEPMISFLPVPFSEPNQDSYEIIFFSSPRAVNYFLERVNLEKNVLIATIGKGTTLAVKDYGFKVDFEGNKSGDSATVAKEFKEFAKEKKVLFPQSSISQQSIQKVLPENQCINLVVYKTELKPQKLSEHPSIIVLTSPSNASAYLVRNEIDEKQMVIAWGETTRNYLLQQHINNVHSLEKSNYAELTDLLAKQLNKR